MNRSPAECILGSTRAGIQLCRSRGCFSDAEADHRLRYRLLCVIIWANLRRRNQLPVVPVNLEVLGAINLTSGRLATDGHQKIHGIFLVVEPRQAEDAR